MNTTEIIVLVIGSICLVFVSWKVSLQQKRFHGIPRFFAFEGILFLVLLNYIDWFKNPFSLIQIISWIMLIASAIIAGTGFYLLYAKGKPEGQLENTTRLITSGIYRYIRHPLYLSLIVGVLGILLKDPGCLQIIVTVIIIVAVSITAKMEEKEMLKKFGAEYINYMKISRMFIPFVF